MTLSIVSWLGTKPPYSSDIILDKIYCSLMEISLVKILYIVLHREMGQNYANDLGLLVLGIRAMNIVLKFFNMDPFL